MNFPLKQGLIDRFTFISSISYGSPWSDKERFRYAAAMSDIAHLYVFEPLFTFFLPFLSVFRTGFIEPGSRSRVLMTKNCKKLQLKKIYIFWIKNSFFYLFLDLHKECPIYRRSFSTLKREHPAQNLRI